jgi:hypothetical protein
MSAEDHLKTAWRAQAAALPARSPQALQAQALATQAVVRRRNRQEVLGAALAIPVFCFYGWLFPSWPSKLGSALVVLASLWVAWQIHRRGANLPLPAELGEQALAFQRSQLLRQRDALHSVWRWYLAPLLPGLLLFGAGMRNEFTGWTLALLLDAGVLAVFAWIHWRNRRAAARLQAEIDALDALV